ADLIIGQIGGTGNQASHAADSLRTPMSLAWDGLNLYVSDAYNRRGTGETPGAPGIPHPGRRDTGGGTIVASGKIAITGEANVKDTVTITIDSATYTYTVVANDTLALIVDGLVSVINSSNSGAGDPNVVATPNAVTASDGTITNYVVLTAR